MPLNKDTEDELSNLLVKLGNWYKSLYTNYTFPPDQVITDSDIRAALHRLILKERREELGSVQLVYGHYVAQTFIDGQTLTIEDRIAQIDSELERSKL